MAYAEHEFWLSSTDKHGLTVEAHYRQLGKEAELAGPEFPELLSYLWNTFLELHSARPAGGMGPGPLTFEGIDAWCRLTGTRLEAWEVRAIKELDGAWLKVQSDSHK